MGQNNATDQTSSRVHHRCRLVTEKMWGRWGGLGAPGQTRIPAFWAPGQEGRSPDHWAYASAYSREEYGECAGDRREREAREGIGDCACRQPPEAGNCGSERADVPRFLEMGHPAKLEKDQR